MPQIETILYDSLFQAVVVGPISGLLFGGLFGWLFSRVQESSEEPRKRNKVIIKIIKEERHYQQNSSKREASSDDASSYMIAVVMLSIFATWGFVAYLDYIVNSLRGCLLFEGATLIGFFAVAFYREGFNRKW